MLSIYNQVKQVLNNVIVSSYIWAEMRYMHILQIPMTYSGLLMQFPFTRNRHFPSQLSSNLLILLCMRKLSIEGQALRCVTTVREAVGDEL